MGNAIADGMFFHPKIMVDEDGEWKSNMYLSKSLKELGGCEFLAKIVLRNLWVPLPTPMCFK